MLAPNTAASNLQQNTLGNSAVTRTGAGAGWTFNIQGDWDIGDTFTVSVDPGTYAGTKGVQCQVPFSPLGVNQSAADYGNYIGFSDIADVDVDPPVYESEFPAGAAPTFAITQTGAISCAAGGHTTYRTLVLTATNGGNGQASQNATVRLGWSLFPGPPNTGPVMFDVGFGATTGPAFFTGGGTGTVAFAVESSVTVVGERPSANSPRSTLVRNTASDAVSGAISEFKISENWPNALPPTDGYWPDPPGGEDLTRHILDANPPGAVCLNIDNASGNSVVFGTKPGWSVDPGASASPNSAAAGPGVVTIQGGGTALLLPVNNSSNTVPTVWTTTGLNLGGTAVADGPVWAYVYWVNGPLAEINCGNLSQSLGQNAYTLGYVQLTTISEVANAVFGHNAEATAAQAINHQFDYAKGSCISNTAGNNFDYGPSIFVARSDYYADGLGAAYAAGTVESGVLLTPPNSLDTRTKDTIRLQGAQTVFVVGGPLAISDGVVNELKDTLSYHCGGVSPRLDEDTGLPKKLVVIRIAGDDVWETNARLAEFVGAEPPAAFGPFGANAATNPFNTSGGGLSQAGTAPGGFVNTALLVTGDNFQDAMVASVPAYGGWALTTIGTGGPMPLIATPSCSYSQDAVDAMFNQHIQQLIVVGGPLAVCDAVISQYLAAIPGLSMFRVAGVNASETSTNLAAFELSPSLGMGWRNVDFDWDDYVNRTAGNINFNTNPNVTAHVVLMTRGDYFADAMSAAAVLSVHNGRYNDCSMEVGDAPDDDDQEDNEFCTKFPLIITESPTSLGAAVTSFLTNSSLYISKLTGASASGGLLGPTGNQNNNISSSVFTIQPIGGPLALSPAILTAAGKLIGS